MSWAARGLALPRGAHHRRPFLGFVIAAADPDESDEVMALVLVEAGDELANLLLGRVAGRRGQDIRRAVVDRVRAPNPGP